MDTSVKADSVKLRYRLLVCGVVQGVGFRPYVYRLADKHGLAGFVLNGATGVIVEVEGISNKLEMFLSALTAQAPPLVRISEVTRIDIPPQGSTGFHIRESDQVRTAFTLVPPDICICEECLAEMRNPLDRRYEYPFTNCTNCGPRYSIIEDVPYDRRKTTMAEFVMCDACQREYDSPEDRRFHAQPNACAICGPALELVIVNGQVEKQLDSRTVLEEAASILLSGRIVALKGLGGYQLACDARQQVAVEELRRRKNRPDKPFAVMASDLAAIDNLCLVSNQERNLLSSHACPIILIGRLPRSPLAEAVCRKSFQIGVMLPYTPLHDLLFQALTRRDPEATALVMTSGNRSEEPILIDNDEAEKKLNSIADAFVHHNRRIHTRIDDSVLRVIEKESLVLRRARGYAPAPIWLGRGDSEILGCGAQQKSTFCLTKKGFGFLSQHLGDLENYETLQFYEETLERMQALFHVEPSIVAHDLHPGYLSTKFAMKFAAGQRVGVQHHHAHIASCMAEHGVDGPVIGVAWDGTGYGTDGTVWGGEFLVADFADFQRHGHLRTVLLAGNEAAIREPWRVAQSYLQDAFDDSVPGDLECWQSISSEKRSVVETMLQRRIHTIETSSCGRLFDAVASLVGLRQKVSFEGQAAIALEEIASSIEEGCYSFVLTEQSPTQVDLRLMIRQIVRNLQDGISVDRIAARFHNTLAAVIRHVCIEMREQYHLKRVCLSGGCFQNARLLRQSVSVLRAEGFEVLFHRTVPTNDGGISLGQAAIACELARQRKIT
jgi:hydrogenase maturation protein HypF